MNKKYLELRKQYPKFIYHGYNVAETNDDIEITYEFEICGLSKFYPKWSFKKDEFYNIYREYNYYKEQLDNAIFNLGMMEIISYNKLTCSKNIYVKCGKLTDSQVSFYKKIYVSGLGEFFFVNDIVEEMNEKTFVEIQSEGVERKCIDVNLPLFGNLVPVGGGKDSALTLEVLKEQKNVPCSINAREAVRFTVEKAGYETSKMYVPKRVLDKNMLKLNSEGFLNGHTPFSAIVAFSTVIMALITGKKYIVLSNESSADEVSVPGTNINHQYSKSLEFENDFRKYVTENIGKNTPEYFSLLRPLNEFQIVKEFSKSEQYFEGFKSCNVGSKQDIWCNSCAKCLYVYIMLCSVTNTKTVLDIFKEDLLDKKSLKDIFLGLVDPNLNKPFECVGTKEEVRLAVNIIIKRYKDEKIQLPVLLKEYIEKPEYIEEQNNLEQDKERIINYWNKENNLPKQFEELLIKFIANK